MIDQVGGVRSCFVYLSASFVSLWSIDDMPVLEICLIISAVLIFSAANVVAIKLYFRGRKIRKKSMSVVYEPVEQDKMGHFYYWQVRPGLMRLQIRVLADFRYQSVRVTGAHVVFLIFLAWSLEYWNVNDRNLHCHSIRHESMQWSLRV